MHFSVISRVTGILLTIFSVALFAPVLIAIVYEESTASSFMLASAITLASGLLLAAPRRKVRDLRSRDGFLITAFFYAGLGFFGAIPFLLTDTLGMAWTDAAFESYSALTTTGATVLSGLDQMPRSILFYRQLLQWLGGMGIIVLAVAILPMLGIGGMQLYKAEAPGGAKDTKLTPRITETAKALWYIYLGLTALCALSYYLAGMGLFDAICHSFSTVAIGGFSTHDTSLAYFASPAIEIVAMVFMVVSGINFGLHFTAFSRHNPLLYFKDIETRLYFAVVGFISLTVCLLLINNGEATENPIRDGFFQAISMATTTGYTTAEFSAWPSGAPFILLFVAFAGGCAGSTAGGIKMIRVRLIFSQSIREIRRLIHPHGVFPIKLGKNRVPDRVVEAAFGFFAAYVLIFLVMVAAIMFVSNLDFITAFSAVGACINNLGPGLGGVAENYAGLSSSVKWVLVLAMVLGRLEIFTLLVLLTPTFWRR